jgi:ketosteroid isomerase-like protein
MTGITVSRRTVLAAGGCALAGAAVFSRAATVLARTDPSGTGDLVRKNYAAWLSKDWAKLDILLADNFTFSSAAPDDHISKATFKAQCWDSQVALIQRFDLELLVADGNEAFAKYVCWTKNGKSFRNVEYFRVKDGKIEALECYFGGLGYPSAANKGQS